MPFLDANTNTSGGLYVMMTELFNTVNGDRPNVPNTAIVITDGLSTWDHNLTVPYAIEAKRLGIRIIGRFAETRLIACIYTE
jgi:collagen type VI alpha